MLRLAIANNVSWCARICALHGSIAELTDRFWINTLPSPPFYPNIITAKSGSEQAVVRAIRQCRDAGLSGSFGIKDSFDDLDLSAEGFDKVVRGHWYGIDDSSFPVADDGDWRKIDPSELNVWVKAWNGDGDPPPDIFRPALLSDPDVMLMARFEDAHITGGAVADFSEQATGISNWFGADQGAGVPTGAMKMIRTLTGTPVVCWSGDPPEDMAAAGFSILGPMSVWIARS